jgi:hypothetical protein
MLASLSLALGQACPIKTSREFGRVSIEKFQNPTGPSGTISDRDPIHTVRGGFNGIPTIWLTIELDYCRSRTLSKDEGPALEFIGSDVKAVA